MGCPWDGFSPANLQFCEASVCGWVTQPANTWSNVGFFLVGLWILYVASHEREPARWLGWIAIATGFGSIALHATSTLAGQLVDQNIMFLESCFFVAFNVRRWLRWSTRAIVALYASLVLVTAAILLRFPKLGIALFVVHVAIFLGIELRLYFRDATHTSYHALLGAGGTFALSWAIWWIDLKRVLCDPHNHVLTGHALWHMLGALSFVFWYRHYAQFSYPQAKAWGTDSR